MKLKDDAYWWQARRESERTARAGLIPSRALQERRILHERTQREVIKDTESTSELNYSNITSSILFLLLSSK